MNKGRNLERTLGWSISWSTIGRGWSIRPFSHKTLKVVTHEMEWKQGEGGGWAGIREGGNDERREGEGGRKSGNEGKKEGGSNQLK